MIDIEEAVYFLMTSAKFETDAGQDTKVSWSREGQPVASGKFRAQAGSITLKIEDREQVFKGPDALRLRKLGVIQN